MGSIIGGLTEHPVQNLPFFFKNSTLFAEYPYLLPCMISTSVTCTGAILSLFLSPDGGSRIGGISLPSEKDVEDVASTVGSLPRKINNKISTYFKDRRSISGTTNGSPSDRISKNRSVSVPYSPIPISLPNERESMRPPIRTSGYGSAYGFGNPLSMSRTSTRQSGSAYGFGDRFPRGRRGVGGIRSTSVATSTRYAPDYDNLQDNTELNFAQRYELFTASNP